MTELPFLPSWYEVTVSQSTLLCFRDLRLNRSLKLYTLKEENCDLYGFKFSIYDRVVAGGTLLICS